MDTAQLDFPPDLAIRVEGLSKIYGPGHAAVYAAANALVSRLAAAGHRRKSAVGQFDGSSPFVDHPVRALQDVSLEIRRGERVGIIGRNGSGKSTLLKIISGVLRPTSGSVATRGRIQSLLELGVGFNPEFTGRENVLTYASLLGLAPEEIARRHAEVAGFAEIGEFMDRPLKHYSSGMVLRLAFATFVLVRPEIVIIDEALAVGDIFFQQRCYDFLRGPLADATKIVVSHDPGQLSALCERLLILQNGRLDYDGPIAPGIERYLKSLHNEGVTPGVAGKSEIRNPKSETAEAESVAALPWKDLPEDGLSGRGALRIVKAAVTDPSGAAIAARAPGERVVVHMLVRVLEPRAHLMFGYLLRDGTGQQVCGQNTRGLQSADGTPPREIDLPAAGDWHVVLEFDWPPLKPQPYTLTLGVGEGFDAHQHVVQCWAHDSFGITGFDPEKTVHGLFGSGLVDCRCAKL